MIYIKKEDGKNQRLHGAGKKVTIVAVYANSRPLDCLETATTPGFSSELVYWHDIALCIDVNTAAFIPFSMGSFSCA